MNDSALRFANIVHRASRAGRPDPTELDATQTDFLVEASQRLGFDRLRVNPCDFPKLPETSHAFWYVDPWVCSGLAAQSTDGGMRYWSFPPDFEQRVRQLITPGR